VGASLLAMTAVNSPKVKSETHHTRANGLLDFWNIGYLCRPAEGLT